MGTIWNAAKRGEGFQLARNESDIVWFLILVSGFFTFVFRFFSGRPLLGDAHRKTDATFLHDATRQLYPNKRPPMPWSRIAEWKRAAIRTGLLIELVCAPIAYFSHGPAGITAAVIGLVLLGNVSWMIGARTVDKVTNYRHRREVEQPLQTGLAQILAMSPSQVKVRVPKPRKASRR